MILSKNTQRALILKALEKAVAENREIPYTVTRIHGVFYDQQIHKNIRMDIQVGFVQNGIHSENMIGLMPDEVTEIIGEDGDRNIVINVSSPFCSDFFVKAEDLDDEIKVLLAMCRL